MEFTLSDQRGGAAAVKRTLTLIVADERTGSIRSQSNVFQVGDVPLNVDASPSLLADGKIRLGFNLQYDWPAPLEGLAAGQDPNNPRTERPPARGTVIKTALHDSVVHSSSKPVVAAISRLIEPASHGGGQSDGAAVGKPKIGDWVIGNWGG